MLNKELQQFQTFWVVNIETESSTDSWKILVIDSGWKPLYRYGKTWYIVLKGVTQIHFHIRSVDGFLFGKQIFA